MKRLAGLSLVIAAGLTGQQPPLSEREAFRLLQRATFGPGRAEVDSVRRDGFAAWIDQQLREKPSETPAYLDEKPLEWAQDYFFQNAVQGKDQLRQRMVLALHKVLVVSGAAVGSAEAYLPYWRVLNRHAFGNYLELMRDITLNPAMGIYLDMLNNDRTEPGSGKAPNENYARELLQLFTLGLTRLNPDGTPKLDETGAPLSAYTEKDVKEFTRAFTGWTYAPPAGKPTLARNNPRYEVSMAPYEPNHDQGEKTLFGGLVLPAGQSAERDLNAALANIFEHENIGPFIARSLIQQFVTSNPGPGYVRRVAGVFDNNGAGVRGDLAAVVRTILLDPDALAVAGRNGGYLTEPALYVARLMRLIGGKIEEHPFLSDEAAQMGQKLLYAPSVFSYFSPSYRVPGTPLAGPEFQILTSETSLTRVNYAARLLGGHYGKDVVLDKDRFLRAASNVDTLMELVDRELMGGGMPISLFDYVRRGVQAQTTPEARTNAALYLTAISPQFQVIE
jgi:uncharacterized protein (DUF1800 family)